MPGAGPRGGPAGVGPSGQFRATGAQYGGVRVSGVTQDSTGAVLGGATVDLFNDVTKTLVASTTSDASTGAYSFPVQSDGSTYFTRCWKAGSPNVFGTSDGGLTGLAPA